MKDKDSVDQVNLHIFVQSWETMGALAPA